MNGPHTAFPPPQGGWPVLEQSLGPPVRALAELVHGCSADPATRTVAVTALVIGCCQLAGNGMTHRMPSLVLVNAGTGDPVDELCVRLVAAGRDRPAETGDTDPGSHDKPGRAERTMTWAIAEKRLLDERGGPPNPEVLQVLEERYFDAQQTAFGSGPSRPYARAWHKPFGLLTDRSGRLILRLDTPGDQQAFRRDVLDRSSELLIPVGYGAGLELVPKHIAVSGTIGTGLWDAEFAAHLVNVPLPVMVLAHCTDELEIPHPRLLQVLASTLPRAFAQPLEEPANFPPGPWFAQYAAELRSRLRHLPGDHEHALQRLARQLLPACLRMVRHIGRFTAHYPRECEALAHDLCAHALRGLTIGVAGLAWHGLGFDAGCPPNEVSRVLGYLRRNGPMSAADLLRRAHLKRHLRNRLVGAFVAEDLVHTDGKTIQPAAFREFVRALHARAAFPEPQNHWAALEAARRPA